MRNEDRRQRAARCLPLLLVPLIGWLSAALFRRPISTAPERLAEPGGQFATLPLGGEAEDAGLRVHYRRGGQGEPVLVLLHGSFLSLFSWRDVFAPLSQVGTVIAFDRPAFGLTERRLPGHLVGGAETTSIYSAAGQADLLVRLLDHLGIERAVLVGNSTGGTIALLTALRHPERVQALVLVAAMVYSGYATSAFPAWLRTLFGALRGPGALLLRFIISSLHDRAIRSFWHDKTRATAGVLATYRKALQMENWHHALWELTLQSRALGLAERLERIAVPTLVVTGEQDQIVTPAQSERLAEEIPNASLVALPACGHLPQEEAPEAFAAAVMRFVARQRNSSQPAQVPPTER